MQTTTDYCRERMFARQVAECIYNNLDTAANDKGYRIHNKAMWNMWLKKPETLLLMMESGMGSNDVIVRYRNHDRDKNGKLKSCEAYLVKKVTLTQYREL